MSRSRPIDRNTDFLLPPSVQEWLLEAPRYAIPHFVLPATLPPWSKTSTSPRSNAPMRVVAAGLPPRHAARPADLWLRHRHLLQLQDRRCEVFPPIATTCDVKSNWKDPTHAIKHLSKGSGSNARKNRRNVSSLGAPFLKWQMLLQIIQLCLAK